jgi:hypothetical protein
MTLCGANVSMRNASLIHCDVICSKHGHRANSVNYANADRQSTFKHSTTKRKSANLSSTTGSKLDGRSEKVKGGEVSERGGAHGVELGGPELHRRAERRALTDQQRFAAAAADRRAQSRRRCAHLCAELRCITQSCRLIECRLLCAFVVSY